MELGSILRGSLDGRGLCGRMDTCVCMTRSLCWAPEAITPLLIGCTPIQKKQYEKAAFFHGNHFFYFYMTWSLRVKIEYHVLGALVKTISGIVNSLHNMIAYDQITSLVFFYLCLHMYSVRYSFLFSGQLLGKSCQLSSDRDLIIFRYYNLYLKWLK